MKLRNSQNRFRESVKTQLAKRAGFKCSICRVNTIGPSEESKSATACIGVAAHIAAASPGGARYDDSMTPADRRSILNGIWLCQSHAAVIDRDCRTWTVNRLKEVKSEHERRILSSIGIAYEGTCEVNLPASSNAGIRNVVPKQYAFLPVKSMVKSYKSLLRPILRDKTLTSKSEMGLLLCVSDADKCSRESREVKWTVFVNPSWLRWYLNGQSLDYKLAEEIPHEQVYGKIPAWPDDYFSFLQAIVSSNSTFIWQRHSDGYLSLVQESPSV